MTTAAIVTLIIATLIVAAAAIGLLRVIFHLMAIRKSLDALEGGVQVIAAKTAPVPAAVAAVNGSLAPVRDFCESI